jgi:hypothetical protein
MRFIVVEVEINGKNVIFYPKFPLNKIGKGK